MSSESEPKKQTRVVWRYDIPTSGWGTGYFDVSMPRGAEILAVATKVAGVDGKQAPSFWALVDPGAELEKRTFVTTATGEQFLSHGDEPPKYLGSFQLATRGESLVFHLFEVYRLFGTVR